MAFRSDIIAGRAVIQVSIQDNLDKQLRSMRSKLFSFSNAINKIGQDLLIFGSLGSAGAFFPVKEFADFQDTMLFVQTKLKDTGVDIVKLEKFIRNLGRTTSFTAKEVAEAAAVLAQAGVGVGVQDLLLPSLDLARASRIDIETSARILTNAMMAFGIGFDEAGKIASQIVTATRLGTTDTILMGESLKEMSGTFRTLNVPFQDAIALVSALSNVSLRGTKAGTSLNTAFSNLTAKLEDLKNLGVVIDGKDFEEPLLIFEKIQKRLAELDTTQQVQELQALFNIRGARAVSGVTVQGLESLKDIMDEIKASSTEARDSAIVLDSRLGGVGRVALSAFQELNLAIGATTEGPLTKFGKGLTNVFNSLSTLASTFPQVTQWLVALPVISLAAGVGLVGMAVAASRLAFVLTGLNAVSNMLFSTMKKLGSAALSPFAAAYTTVVAQPIAGISATVARENSLIAKHQATLSKLLGAATPNPGNIAQARTRLANAQAARSFFNMPVEQLATRQVNSIKKGFSTVRTTYLKALTEVTRPSRTAARRSPLNVIPASLSTVFLQALHPRKLLGTLDNLTDLAAKGFSRLFTGRGLFTALDIFVKSILGGTKGLLNAFRGLFTILNGMRRFVFSLSGFMTILEFLIIAGPKIAPIKAIFDGIGRAFSAAFSTIGDTIRDLAPLFTVLGGGLLNLAFGNTLQGLETVKVSLKSIIEILTSGFKLAWERFKDEAQKGINFVKTLLTGLLGTFSIIGTAIGEAIGTLVGSRPQPGDETKPFEYGDGPINALKSFFNTVFSVLEGVAITVIQALDTVRTVLVDIYNLLLRLFNLIANSTFFGDPSSREASRQLSGGRFELEAQLVAARKELQVAEDMHFGRKAAELRVVIEDLENQLAKLGEATKVDYIGQAIAKVTESVDKARAALDKAVEGIAVDVEKRRAELAEANAKASKELFLIFTGVNLNQLFAKMFDKNAGMSLQDLFETFFPKAAAPPEHPFPGIAAKEAEEARKKAAEERAAIGLPPIQTEEEALRNEETRKRLKQKLEAVNQELTELRGTPNMTSIDELAIEVAMSKKKRYEKELAALPLGPPEGFFETGAFNLGALIGDTVARFLTPPGEPGFGGLGGPVIPETEDFESDVANAITGLDAIIKTVSGFGADAMGQKLQILPNRVEQKMAEDIAGVNDGVASLNTTFSDLASRTQPFVFSA